MPVREPRQLYFTRELFMDYEFMTQLTAEHREAYLGIWQLADDSGWLDWQPVVVAAHLYRFDSDPLGHLQRIIPGLIETGRLIIHDCGHAQLPRGLKQRRPGRPGPDAHAIHNAHHQNHTKNDPVNDLHARVPSLPNPTPPRARARAHEGSQNGHDLTVVGDVAGNPDAPWNQRVAKVAKS